MTAVGAEPASVVVAVAGNAASVVAVAACLFAVAESAAVAAVVMSVAVAVCPCYSEGQQSVETSLLKQGSLLPPLWWSPLRQWCPHWSGSFWYNTEQCNQF